MPCSRWSRRKRVFIVCEDNMSPVFVSPQEVNENASRSVMVVDIRVHEESRREHIAEARNIPLESLKPGCFSDAVLLHTDAVVFHCQSGSRTDPGPLCYPGIGWRRSGFCRHYGLVWNGKTTGRYALEQSTIIQSLLIWCMQSLCEVGETGLMAVSKRSLLEVPFLRRFGVRWQ
ncbi:rhodanese-like domain-containing protein [Candidatus Pantoea formicae]|uniref:rhodanese-like domain-containing protein n=1 Tax=Candidatus Pantoea formicae TaxID=2608355 RepID=UPI003EDAB49F